MKYAIYPPIGIARVGNSTTGFFIGPETPDSAGTELLADGSEQPLSGHKDSSFRVKRQAARFRVFEIDEATGEARPAQLAPGTSIRWTVKLANKKDAVIRSGEPPQEDPENPVQIPVPSLDSSRDDRHIRAEGEAPAFGQAAVKLSGTYLQTEVLLGELLCDPNGNLLVLGGHGLSQSPEQRPIGSEPGGGGFYNNRGWYDDVSDGSVSAEILPGGGAASIPVTPAWVIVAPPDFAPEIQGVVTLYDVMRQAALNAGLVTLPAKPSFSRDIWPMLRRAVGLRWVNGFNRSNSHWKQFSTDWASLSDPSPAAAVLRRANARLLREIGSQGELQNFSLRPWQETYLNAWADGDFANDFDGTLPDSGNLSAEVLTRTVLDHGVGQGFFPGIEAGIIVTNETLYAEPYRFGNQVTPGDLTALMALPWQADFLKCRAGWWPSQRPDDAPQAASATAKPWIRPIGNGDHRSLVANYGRLGFIEPRTVDGQQVYFEVDRDPTF